MKVGTHKVQIFKDSLMHREVYGFNPNEPFRSKADAELYVKNEESVDQLFKERRREYVIRKLSFAQIRKASRRASMGVLD